MARATNGLTVRALRVAVGVTARDLASRVSISAGYLAHIEAGKKQPRPAVTRRLADALGVPLDAITYIVPDQAAPQRADVEDVEEPIPQAPALA